MVNQWAQCQHRFRRSIITSRRHRELVAPKMWWLLLSKHTLSHLLAMVSLVHSTLMYLKRTLATYWLTWLLNDCSLFNYLTRRVIDHSAPIWIPRAQLNVWHCTRTRSRGRRHHFTPLVTHEPWYFVCHSSRAWQLAIHLQHYWSGSI